MGIQSSPSRGCGVQGRGPEGQVGGAGWLARYLRGVERMSWDTCCM